VRDSAAAAPDATGAVEGGGAAEAGKGGGVAETGAAVDTGAGVVLGEALGSRVSLVSGSSGSFAVAAATRDRILHRCLTDAFTRYSITSASMITGRGADANAGGFGAVGVVGGLTLTGAEGGVRSTGLGAALDAGGAGDRCESGVGALWTAEVGEAGVR
jgi:hypothetical protein